MILSDDSKTEAFTSGTTSFFEPSIRHAPELSITVMPASANCGAHSSEVFPPAEKSASAGFAAIASFIPTTPYFFPLKLISFPTDLSEATGISSVTGKFLSARICNIFVPTRPVAPTTATFMCSRLFLIATWNSPHLFITYKRQGSFHIKYFYKENKKV